ncbi:MAG TPA: molybdopterin cofactor-binding domain-containing protein [Vicinamibacterales bacterium]|nr:molybdopterin cofactor-binding domain-containing protein [Vicinamibacterales bacterium]
MTPAKPSRRQFLQSTGAVAGLTLAFHMPEALAQAPATAFEPNAYLRITPDDTVTLWASKLEMGQGVRTLLPMMIAEELDVDWARVRVEQPSPGGRFAGIELHTSGSGSSSGQYRTLRVAGAAAREMLVAAAARTWNVDPATCHTSRGVVTHAPTGRRQTYGQLAAAAAALPVPKSPALKDAAAFRLLGTPTKRVDGPAIVTGKAAYGADARVPGMLFATIERAPTLSATLGQFDAADALKLPGVTHVIPVTRGIHPGVAVVATDTWAALKGRRALRIDWRPGPFSTFDSDQFLERLQHEALDRAIFPVRREGDVVAAMASSARQIEATYVFPFQAHAAVETMNCTADVRADSAEFWVPTQTDVRTLQQAAKVTGLAPDRIRVHCQLAGGGFGRRLFADFVAEAAEISKTIGRPVQLLWTRQDDMRHGHFQPATANWFKGGLDANGALVALQHKTQNAALTIYDIHGGRNIWTNPLTNREIEPDVWGAYDNPYEIRHLRVDCADATSPVPVGPWRAVEYPATVFGRESFLDELAHAAGADPVAFRLALLPRNVKRVGEYAIDRGRLARVLEAVRDRSGWTRPVSSADGRRRGRGIAANVYHAGSYVAMVAEVSVAADGSDLRVERITASVDCGIALNPLGVEGQTESGIAWGLSATLLGKIDFKAGAAVQSTYQDFRVLRMNQMPALDIQILDSQAMPGGYGEHPVPPVAPAVANAVFAATGKRIRALPLTHYL